MDLRSDIEIQEQIGQTSKYRHLQTKLVCRFRSGPLMQTEGRGGIVWASRGVRVIVRFNPQFIQQLPKKHPHLIEILCACAGGENNIHGLNGSVAPKTRHFIKRFDGMVNHSSTAIEADQADVKTLPSFFLSCYAKPQGREKGKKTNATMSSSGLSRLLLRTTTPLLHRRFSTTATTTTVASVFRVNDAVEDIFKERDYNRLVEKFKDFSKHYRFRCRHNVYDHAVRQLAAVNRLSDIEEILEEQKKHTHLAKEGFYIRLIVLYGRAGMVDHAIKAFDEMPGLGCDRTVKSMNAVLTACADAKDFDKVGVLFRELPKKLGVKPDDYSYNILASAFCEVGSVDLAFSLLGEMRSNGINPDLITFNTLLDGFYRGDRRSEAEKVWTEMGKYGIEPNTSSFNAKIRGLIAEGKTAETVKVLEGLESRGLKPDSLSFSLLVKAYCVEGNLEEAKKVLQELRKKDMQPNRLAYEAIIPALCAAEDLNMASELCLEVLNRNRFINAEVLQDVINRLVKISKDKKAKRLVELGSEKSYHYSSLKMPS